MSLADLLSGMGGLIEPQLNELCDLIDVRFTTIDGEQKPDASATNTVASNVRCSYEPLVKAPAQQIAAGALSASVDHQLTMRVSPAVLSIRSNFIIKVHANVKTGRGELIFEEPGRLDYSLSPLVAVAAVLRNK